MFGIIFHRSRARDYFVSRSLNLQNIRYSVCSLRQRTGLVKKHDINMARGFKREPLFDQYTTLRAFCC